MNFEAYRPLLTTMTKSTKTIYNTKSYCFKNFPPISSRNTILHQIKGSTMTGTAFETIYAYERASGLYKESTRRSYRGTPIAISNRAVGEKNWKAAIMALYESPQVKNHLKKLLDGVYKDLRSQHLEGKKMIKARQKEKDGYNILLVELNEAQITVIRNPRSHNVNSITVQINQYTAQNQGHFGSIVDVILSELNDNMYGTYIDNLSFNSTNIAKIITHCVWKAIKTSRLREELNQLPRLWFIFNKCQSFDQFQMIDKFTDDDYDSVRHDLKMLYPRTPQAKAHQNQTLEIRIESLNFSIRNKVKIDLIEDFYSARVSALMLGCLVLLEVALIIIMAISMASTDPILLLCQILALSNIPLCNLKLNSLVTRGSIAVSSVTIGIFICKGIIHLYEAHKLRKRIEGIAP